MRLDFDVYALVLSDFLSVGSITSASSVFPRMVYSLIHPPRNQVMSIDTCIYSGRLGLGTGVNFRMRPKVMYVLRIAQYQKKDISFTSTDERYRYTIKKYM
jgi:hypothetical protein